MNTPTRFSVIETAHRGIRNALAQLSLQAGNTDYTDPAEVAALKSRTETILALLNEHAHTENTLILPLLEGKAPAGAVHDAEDHDRIHQLQDALLEQIERLASGAFQGEAARAAGRVFYQDLSKVHAAHLEHMIEEERGSQVLIWEHYTDDELRQIQAKILQKLNPALQLAWMRYILPALPADERRRMLQIHQTNAPAERWQQLQELMREVIPNFVLN